MDVEAVVYSMKRQKTWKQVKHSMTHVKMV